MADEVTTCPSCGETSRDPQWCEHCGTRLVADEGERAKWLEVGSNCTLEDTEGRRLAIEISEAVDTFSTRRVTFGRVVDGPSEWVGRRVMVEERETPDGDVEERIPTELQGIFRPPLGRGANGPRTLRCYEDTGALTLEDLVDISGELSYQQIKEAFLAILDTVAAAHSARRLILAIAPWTIRLEDVHVPQARGDETHVLPGREGAPTVEHPRGDAPTPRPGEPEKPADGEVTNPGRLEVDSTAIEEPTEEPDILSGRTIPGHRPPDEVRRAAARLEDDEDDVIELVERAEDDESYVSAPEAEHDVDDLWGALDDESDALGETGILHGGVAAALAAPEARAYFEGIDELFGFDGQPYEVPVIMGFSPPELLGRVRADIGPHCDVFALGMILYYMIAGRVPPSSVYTRYSPAIPARNFRPGFPPGLQPIISRATRPTPTDRFASVHAMREAFVSACALMERRARAVTGRETPKVVLAVDTHVGIAKARRNPKNQDSVFGKVADDGRFALVVIADGVSTASYGSGDKASHFLTAAAAEVWADVLPRYLMDERVEEVEVISTILERANESIVNHVNEHHTPFEGNPHEVMGTTALVCIIRDGVITLAALGDSRAYVQTPNGLEQVTADHNLWTLSVIDGVTADAALSMPHGDALARCLGTFIVDKRRLISVRPDADFFRFALSRGDTLLLTTDGLVDFAGANPFASEEAILAAMRAEPDPALACLELILLANRGGGGDNIGVGIAHFI